MNSTRDCGLYILCTILLTEHLNNQIIVASGYGNIFCFVAGENFVFQRREASPSVANFHAQTFPGFNRDMTAYKMRCKLAATESGHSI